ncbi:phenylalanine--tRNA ligase beta subunit-related protein, partial [Streptomyces sp. T-3]|nr:phenylalanine--tRNA ligase beta subunit-related protein [Streptomyces sp. T-3]
MTLELTVSDEVRALVPGFTRLAIEAQGLVNGPSTEASSALLDDAARRLAERLAGQAPHEDPHMAAWRAAYTAFGSKPNRTRNSAEALAKRALADGGLPRINLLVDLYNAISVAHLIPVGGED